MLKIMYVGCGRSFGRKCFMPILPSTMLGAQEARAENHQTKETNKTNARALAIPDIRISATCHSFEPLGSAQFICSSVHLQLTVSFEQCGD
jgi:hypothetical protein